MARPRLTPDFESQRALAAALPGATEDIKWGADLVYSVGGKMFCVFLLDAGRARTCSFEVDAERFLELTGVPGVILSALASLRMTGSCGLIGVQQGDLVLDPLALVGKTVVGILEGSAEPRGLIPRLIELWQAGDLPFDRLIEEFPLDRIDEAEAASLSGRVVKPVLRP